MQLIKMYVHCSLKIEHWTLKTHSQYENIENYRPFIHAVLNNIPFKIIITELSINQMKEEKKKNIII